MSEFEFISRLRRSLAGLPEEEIDKAVEYYEDYFTEAEEGEEEVINQLASPEEIAENIRREVLGKSEKTGEAEEPQGNFTERGFETKQDREQYQEIDRFTSLSQSPKYDKKEESEESYYDEKKERRKNRRFFTRLFWIFGIFWIVVFLCIFMFVMFKDSEEGDSMTQYEEETTTAREEADTVMEQPAEEYSAHEETSVHAEDTMNTVVPDQNIESIKIKIQTGTVKIRTGTEFSLTH